MKLRESPPFVVFVAILLFSILTDFVADGHVIKTTTTTTKEHQDHFYTEGFLTSVDNVLNELLEIHSAFWTEGKWYNMTIRPPEEELMRLYYEKTSPIEIITDPTDPTNVYSKEEAGQVGVAEKEEGNRRSRRDLPFIYQASPPAKPCTNAASTSIISGSKAVDFASFAIGILTLVININNNVNNNNNNDNNVNFNAVDSSNIVANFNTNNANQVNVMPPGGKRRKRSVVGTAAILAMAAIKAHMNLEAKRILNKSKKPIKIDLRNDSHASRVNSWILDNVPQTVKTCHQAEHCLSKSSISLFI